MTIEIDVKFQSFVSRQFLEALFSRLSDEIVMLTAALNVVKAIEGVDQPQHLKRSSFREVFTCILFVSFESLALN